MKFSPLSFADTQSFSPLFLDYVSQKPSLKNFYGYFPSVENIAKQIELKKNFPSSHRAVLHATLTKQYASLPHNEEVKKNIDSLLSPDTFTITTGHQLTFLASPLYFVYKILTVIKAAQTLKEKYPTYHVVPVYWMASEDHDAEEVCATWVHGKKYSWEIKEQGAVGEFSTEAMKKVLKEIPGVPDIFHHAFTKYKTVADATRYAVHALFSKYGLVVLDGNDRELKKLFAPVIENEFQQKTFPLIQKQSHALAKLHYSVQVNPREINLFYLDKKLRKRWTADKNRFTIHETELQFSWEEVKKMVEQTPEKFSPNVCLRPLYQEMILPNLAYCGGPGELAYWLQLKTIFDFYHVPFPMLLPRFSALLVEKNTDQLREKLKLSETDIFQKKETIVSAWLKNFQQQTSLEDKRHEITALFTQIRQQAQSLDTTLVQHTEAKHKQLLSALANMEKKFIRAVKRRETDTLRQIDKWYNALHPNGHIQEREENMISFLPVYPQLVEQLHAHINPFDFRFQLIYLP